MFSAVRAFFEQVKPPHILKASVFFWWECLILKETDDRLITCTQIADRVLLHGFIQITGFLLLKLIKI